MDFYDIVVETKTSNNRTADHNVYPDFKFAHVKDLVCKGGGLYAFWDEDHWNTNIDDLILKIDASTFKKVQELKEKSPDKIVVGKYLNSSRSRLMQDFDRYSKLRKQSEEQFNTKILFADDTIKRSDYATTKLPYTPEEGETEAFDELMGVLYSKKELEKILWFMGALLTNSMPEIQKFLYLYGGKGTGKGTAIKILKMVFEGYHRSISLMQLTSGSEFATAQVQEVPLLIDDDSDMSRIKNDTNLLKMTSHEPISVNAKYKETYDVTFNGLLVTASNKRFQVRNIDSGITRRAVVAEPTNKTHNPKTYLKLMDLVKYEIPMIAEKAILLFNAKGAHYYEEYMDVGMAEATDHIFSFVRENYMGLGDPCTLKKAGELYKLYLEDIGFDTSGYKRKIKNELERYYEHFFDEKRIDGEKFKNVYEGFKYKTAFPEKDVPKQEQKPAEDIFEGLDAKVSTFDRVAQTYPAQLATPNGTPTVKWDECKTTLSDIDTTKLHYVRLPLNHIVIDFDIKNDKGEKDLEMNLKASKRFPPTYTELSKSGKGVHLHYIYDGEVGNLESIYDDDVEIKVFSGKQSLRRKLTKHNDAKITHITTGLPTKKKDGASVYSDVKIISWNEKKMRTAIKGNLNKQYHDATKPSVDFIVHIFKEAEENGIKYDLRDMRQDIMVFASQSSNNASYCLKAVRKINYSTIDEVKDTQEIQQGSIIVPDEDIYFYDVEVFSNLFVICYKRYGDDEVVKLINPPQATVEKLLEKPLVGFNNRRYDNHIMYGGMLGEDNLGLYRQSQRIINDKDARSGMYGGAYELSYADIYDYASKKQSLKKWEIELGIHHDELEIPWDQPVPEDMWERVAEYCANDVIATEEVFKATYYDYTARLILAELSGLKINATTTQHAAAFLFGNDPRPQDKFIYTDLSETFPGYKFSYGKSEYRGEDPGEGGYVYSEPGVYENVALDDVESMHPNSLIAMNYFGPYTAKYKELMDTRLAVKHGDYATARKAFGGILEKFLQDEEMAGKLSYALKIIINIVYGMTSAKFDNKFRHPKNVDNIVAKRGALFMIDLKHEVQKRGYTVAHIKTDSIKVPNADKEILDFIDDFGSQYGYKFDLEHTYKKMALVNKAVYIAQMEDDHWEAVGAQFADPYVYKTLFSHEEIVEEDYALTKSATAPIYLGNHFVGKVAQVYASLTGEEMLRVTEEKTGAITGTKGHKWRLMSDYRGKDDLDMSYYDGLVKSAIDAIDKVGDKSVIFEEELPELPF